MNVRLIAITKPVDQNMDSEGLMAYCARVSSPHQENPEFARLLNYCIKHAHWSVFEHAYMTVEISTTRSISAQILRHRSFCFQEFSQRYAAVTAPIELKEARRQDHKNRQNSIDDLSPLVKLFWKYAQKAVYGLSRLLYKTALKLGIAKESAREILPIATPTKMYMTGNVRSWLHYLWIRGDKATQKEHRDIAVAIRGIFTKEFPIVSQAAGFTNLTD